MFYLHLVDSVLFSRLDPEESPCNIGRGVLCFTHETLIQISIFCEYNLGGGNFMGNKILQVTGSEPMIDFLDIVFKSSEFLYAKRTGNIIGLAFINRPGELVVQFQTVNEAIEALEEIKKLAARGN